MAESTAKPKDIDEYIAGFLPEVQERLQKIRETIRSAAPESEETIKYGMPTYVLEGNLIYFAVYKKHIGVYPVPEGDAAFQADLEPYRSMKSTARFPHDRPVPYELIGRFVEFRIDEHLARAAAKGKSG
ncbi:MAG TPA: DUF1801 domain-containing protein [Anaerolineales bacterium]|nr:DUF1801 domain-containing protein [Anaerolineales bacterium]